MNPYARILQPASSELEGLLSGTYVINEGANRIVDAGTKRFVAALVPGAGLSDTLAQLPLNPTDAARVIQASEHLRRLEPFLSVLQLTTSVGALASVANLGVSCVGFAVVLRRLGRIEGKLDEALTRLEVIQQAVNGIGGHVEALSAGRLRSAAESLERALSADSSSGRRDLALRARDLFQETKNLNLELWRQTEPWGQLAIPVPTAMELQTRFVAAAIGEIQAEFVGGDMGAFRHAARSVASDYISLFRLDAPAALRLRSDQACDGGSEQIARFGFIVPQITAELRLAAETCDWTHRRLVSFEEDADLPEQLGADPVDVARATRAATGDDLYVLRRQ